MFNLKGTTAFLLASAIFTSSLLAGCQSMMSETTSKAETTKNNAVTTEQKAAVTTAEKWTPAVPPESDDVIVRVADYIEDVVIDIRYGSTNNSTGTQIYKFGDAYLRYGTVKKLENAAKLLAEKGLKLVIWDAFRPLEAQMSLYYTQPECMTTPSAGKYLRFNNADAVSVSAVRSDGGSIELPSDFFGENKERNSSGVTAAAKENAQIIDDAMLQSGMVRYLDDEWYNYADSDEYPLAATTTVDSSGVHECESWIVDCNEAISLRKEPSTDSDSVIRVAKGEKVKVMFFTEKFAYCEYNGSYGYALAAYIVQSDENGYKSDISVVNLSEDYDYYEMQEDLAELVSLYPGKISLKSIGKSEEGRDMTVAIVGNPDSDNRIFISAAIHAREYMTAVLAMAQIEYLLSHGDTAASVGEVTISQMLDDVCICFLPFTNPDGAYIVTSGKIPDEFKKRYGSSYAAKWKANAKGVDLNANFDADWESYGGYLGSTGRPSYMSYKGTAPESAAEAKAVADYIRSENFDTVLCYHTSGSYIYASYKDYTETNDKSNKIARYIAGRSGYVIAPQSGTSTAGLKDWCIKIGIPSVTVEFGTSTNPLMLREFDNIWARTKDIPYLAYLWVSRNT
jgi:g-D-glutamyl-meso-diaminopimelate peptidase